MKQYEKIVIEITEQCDVVSTSPEIETGKIPLSYEVDAAAFEF